MSWAESISAGVTALATVAIAAYTIVLAKVSKKQYKSTMDALELSRTEFVSTHRPRIRIKHVWLQSGKRARDRMSIKLLTVNTGDTPATIINLRLAFHMSPDGNDLLPEQLLEEVTRIARTDRVISGSTIVYPDLTDGTILDQHDVDLMSFGTVRLFCIGDVEYVDDLGAVRKTAFCRVWNAGKFALPSDPDPNYEYQD